MERDFKGVWIPKEIWLNEELGWSEKLLLVEIDSLAKNGECFASNEYLAKFIGCHKKHISRLISNLADLNLVRVELIYKANSKQIDKRIIHVTTGNKNVPTPEQKCSDPRNENVPTPRNKKVEDSSFISNTDISNTIINTTNKRIPRKQLLSEFETLWKNYPNKKGKEAAQKSYLEARKNNECEYEEVSKGIEMYVKYIRFHRIDITKIKHGSTWFNQKCWTDEYGTDNFQKNQQFSRFTETMLNEMENPNAFLDLLGVEGYEERRSPRIIVASEG